VDSLDFISILIIALGLSADCFAVALGGGFSIKKISVNQVLRISFSFGIFQAIMPAIGWLVGNSFAELIESFDHWIAFGLLVFIGGRMLWEFLHPEKEAKKDVDITRGIRLLILSIATSIDSLAAGLSFAFLEVNIVMAIATIGIVAFIITAIGFITGRKAGNLFGRWADLAGGVILIGIGLRILITHLVQG